MKTDFELKKELQERDNDGYEEFLKTIQQQFNKAIKLGGKFLFSTSVDTNELFPLFLEKLPENARQHYNCRTCRHFVERFGNLVTISDAGQMDSVVWAKKEEVPEFFKDAVGAVRRKVLRHKVVSAFISDENTLGVPVTGIWHHMSLTLPTIMVNRDRLNTGFQLYSALNEDFRTLINAMQEYSVETITKVVEILQTADLYRSETFLPTAEWFLKVKIDFENNSSAITKQNIVWKTVATAPNGFCHIKSGMVGTLLDDIAEGMSYPLIKAKYEERMGTYRRSQSAPSTNALVEAEREVKRLGIEDSLDRRYATLEEIPEFIWKSPITQLMKKEESQGVFSKITPKDKTITSSNINPAKTVMTFDKFAKTILPSAQKIEVKTDNINRFMALVTAANEEAPNIMQWDNPYSWYYHGGIDGEIKKRVESAGGQYENNDIRCSLIWNTRTDLDLHCITPRGNEIYFSNKRYDNGYLDVDMNVHGETDTPVENIRWTKGKAINGHYKFFVHNYTNRAYSNSFTVELEVNGQLYTFSSDLTSQGNREVAFEFDYRNGQITFTSFNAKNQSTTSTTVNTWNVPNNAFVEVTGITNSPNMWGSNNVVHSGEHVFFLLKDCKDNSEGKGRGFFTEMLTSDLQKIRKTLEAYTSITPISGVEFSNACGMGFLKGTDWNVEVKVTTNNSSRIIKIDRFD